ncbi:diguanylate cyclase (GGDEF) domain-containing protein [Abditibacterium utsteinense]|uniref:diguanylate cyclase n=1 Tax=Abditibacterium utsteinense TaxID=1960156 RepID=A0A2S8SXN3_9BACT|nr:GGDEF domain-containing protein [Abditibacterium utsteinense]PQV65560.1 diguanylate cyclase (GGDEF) domain-containing protein [Abditibacterium utsteinense]
MRAQYNAAKTGANTCHKLMKDPFFPSGDLHLPTLRPAARVLLLSEEADENGGFLLQGRAHAAGAMKRLVEVADSAGHFTFAAPIPRLIDGVNPEVVLVDGASRSAARLLQEARSAQPTRDAVILALVPAKMHDELLEALRAAGADDFLSDKAQLFEIVSRLEAATALRRARAEIAELREYLGRQIRVDDLTGVMSRRFFFQQAHRECSRARRYGHRLSCVMIEIDHYKSLCATFGDFVGEAVLRQTATIIGQWTRDSDLVARFTDSKFILILPETGIEGATRAQDKITLALGTHIWRFDSTVIPVSVSIGEAELQPGPPMERNNDDYISEGDETGDAALSTRESLAGLLEDADAALFVARKGARMPEVFVPYTPVPDTIARTKPAPDNQSP